jgi:hypothetical protein
MDTPNLRRLVQPEFVAVFKDGVHWKWQAKQIAKSMIECLGIYRINPCPGSADTMVLTITL